MEALTRWRARGDVAVAAAGRRDVSTADAVSVAAAVTGAWSTRSSRRAARGGGLGGRQRMAGEESQRVQTEWINGKEELGNDPSHRRVMARSRCRAWRRRP